MPEKAPIGSRNIFGLLFYIAGVTCGLAEQRKKKKPFDMAEEFQSAVATGMLIAHRYPDLGEACSQYWDFTYEKSAREYVDGIINDFKEWLKSEKKKARRSSPSI